MRNTNFKKYAGLSKWSQRGGLENLSVKRTQISRNPLKTLTFSPLQKTLNSAHLTQYLTLLKLQFNTQEYFAIRRRYSPRRVCETQISKNTQAYRSGHNEAVLKTVCLTGTGVRIPQPAPKNTNFSVGVFLFFVFYLCAVTMGEERKTVDNCFSRTKSTKQREMKQGYALSTFRLCDLTGHVVLKTVWV